MGVEIQNNAMAQNRMRYVLNIVHTQMETAVQQGRNASAFHQRLRAAGRTSEADVLLRGFVRFRLIRLSSHHHLDGVIHHMRRHHDLAADAA